MHVYYLLSSTLTLIYHKEEKCSRGISIPRFQRKITKKSGLPPGTLVYVGKNKSEQVKVTCINYDVNSFEEKPIGSIN
jgi:hypothetical protein